LLSLPAFEGALQVPLFLPSVFLLLAEQETLEELVLAREQPVKAYPIQLLDSNEHLNCWGSQPPLILGKLALTDTDPIREFLLRSIESPNLP
jgi:hypothetical protein